MTDRLVLREFTPEDAGDILEYISPPEMSRYSVYTLPRPYTMDTARQLAAMFSDPPDSQGLLQVFAIVLDGKVIGEIELNRHPEDFENNRIELAYSIVFSHWNRGLMTEAARAAMDWAFRTFPINRIYAWSDPRNTGSWRVMEKLGMKYEGLLRAHTKWEGTFRDRVYYGILREEWEKLAGI